jgi:hypothetical protein
MWINAGRGGARSLRRPETALPGDEVLAKPLRQREGGQVVRRLEDGRLPQLDVNRIVAGHLDAVVPRTLAAELGRVLRQRLGPR